MYSSDAVAVKFIADISIKVHCLYSVDISMEARSIYLGRGFQYLQDFKLVNKDVLCWGEF